MRLDLMERISLVLGEGHIYCSALSKSSSSGTMYPTFWKYWLLMIHTFLTEHCPQPQGNTSPKVMALPWWMRSYKELAPNWDRPGDLFPLQNFPRDCPGLQRQTHFRPALPSAQFYLPHCCIVYLLRVSPINPLHKTPHLNLRQSKTRG